tara:strand:+ start:12081 stop:12725 length:645 start_codon:yes stop_codon:yes gene_type:complete
MIFNQQAAIKTAKYLLQINAIKLSPENPFSWASGWKSPIYCDNRIALSYPLIRNYIADQITIQVKSIHKNQKFIIAGVATGAIGIGMLVAHKMNRPFIYVRPETKKHGKKNQIEGYIPKNPKIIVIEDLISTGKSSLNAVEALKKIGADVIGMFGIFSYELNIAQKNFNKSNIKLSTLCSYDILVKEAIKQNIINSDSLNKLSEWKKSPENWGS